MTMTRGISFRAWIFSRTSMPPIPGIMRSSRIISISLGDFLSSARPASPFSAVTTDQPFFERIRVHPSRMISSSSITMIFVTGSGISPPLGGKVVLLPGKKHLDPLCQFGRINGLVHVIIRLRLHTHLVAIAGGGNVGYDGCQQ